MNARISKSIEIYGVEIQIGAEFEYGKTASSVPFEHFGFRGSHSEGQTTFEGFNSGVRIESNLAQDVEQRLMQRGIGRTRRFYRMKRQLMSAIEKATEKMNPAQFWDSDECLDTVTV